MLRYEFPKEKGEETDLALELVCRAEMIAMEVARESLVILDQAGNGGHPGDVVLARGQDQGSAPKLKVWVRVTIFL